MRSVWPNIWAQSANDNQKPRKLHEVVLTA
jgi:hypothetical protein